METTDDALFGGRLTLRQPRRGYRFNLDAVLLALEDRDASDVYVLSDGAPSSGEHVYRSRVRERIRDRNRVAKMRIHTVDFQERTNDPERERRLERHRDLMRRIARVVYSAS